MPSMTTEHITKIRTARDELSTVLNGGLSDGARNVAIATALKNTYEVLDELVPPAARNTRSADASAGAVVGTLNAAAIMRERHGRGAASGLVYPEDQKGTVRT
jgi:hypothetical protein